MIVSVSSALIAILLGESSAAGLRGAGDVNR
jgi:hypothetical protein